MGVNKLLLAVEGESLLRRAARRALAGGVDPLLVVLGHEAELARRELAHLPCEVVVNARHAEGITTSIAAGLLAVPAGVGAAMVLLADMPFVSSAMIAALVERYRATPTRLVLSRYGEALAPPMLYDRALFPELTALAGGSCGQRVAKRHLGEAEVLTWPESALTDLDRPEDYARFLSQHAEVA